MEKKNTGNSNTPTPKKGKVLHVITWLVFISLVASAVFIIIRLIQSPSQGDELGEKSKSDYILMVLQCVLGIVAMLLPGWLGRRWKLEIPSLMISLYVLFLYAAIYLGEVRSFYYRFEHFDALLHATSGAMLGALAFTFIDVLNRYESAYLKLSPLFVALFAFMFASTLGIFWEFYEYAMDGLLGLNMQKFLMEDGSPFVGRAALKDTMGDFMINAIGSFTISLIGYISLKYKKGWVEKLMIRKKPLK